MTVQQRVAANAASGSSPAPALSGAPEAVRLVIWDLDETFWGGTLTEGGISWREEHAEIVRELSRRGIVNAICSKNDFAPVEAILQERGIREHFVFPSISWEPKGPRIAALVVAVQLRAPTILFIDDNPMNRAEAQHYAPGLQVADETIVPRLLDDPRLRGKPDPELKRLAQYKLLERRQDDQKKAGGDTANFLRESNITVTIEHDLEPHLDRAVELINRTNQLNFTKKRLPEEPEAARAALRELLHQHAVQAGIVRVRDNYGDYGYIGLYVTQRNRNMGQPELLHYCFSCRTLGMGIESWMYQKLGRPTLAVQGEVLTDVINDHRDIDWVRVAAPGEDGAARELPRIDYILARGACDMRAIIHYFGLGAQNVVEEVAEARGGKTPLTCSSQLAVYALRGVPEKAVIDAAPLGYEKQDFTSLIADPPAAERAVWMLNFLVELPVPLLRHKATGALIPVWIPALKGPPLRMLANEPDKTGLEPALVAYLREKFEMFGFLTDEMFRDNLRLILQQARAGTSVFILLANEQGRGPDGALRVLPGMQNRNAQIRAVSAEFPCVTLLAPADFMSAEELAGLERPHHYDRMVYFRMYQRIMQVLAGG
jgi:FkbH-like protein